MKKRSWQFHAYVYFGSPIQLISAIAARHAHLLSKSAQSAYASLCRIGQTEGIGISIVILKSRKTPLTVHFSSMGFSSKTASYSTLFSPLVHGSPFSMPFFCNQKPIPWCPPRRPTIPSAQTCSLALLFFSYLYLLILSLLILSFQSIFDGRSSRRRWDELLILLLRFFFLLLFLICPNIFPGFGIARRPSTEPTWLEVTELCVCIWCAQTKRSAVRMTILTSAGTISSICIIFVLPFLLLFFTDLGVSWFLFWFFDLFSLTSHLSKAHRKHR